MKKIYIVLISICAAFAFIFWNVNAENDELSGIENFILRDMWYYLSNSEDVDILKTMYLEYKDKILLYFDEEYGSLQSEDVIELHKLKARLSEYISSDVNGKRYIKEAVMVLIGIYEYEAINNVFSYDSNFILKLNDEDNSFQKINKFNGESSSLWNFQKLECTYLSDFVDSYKWIWIIFEKSDARDQIGALLNWYTQTEQVSKNGVRVRKVSYSSPASKAWIKQGDIITKVDGVWELQNMEIPEISQLFQWDIWTKIRITLESGKEIELKREKIYSYNDNRDYDNALELIWWEEIYEKIASHRNEVFEIYENIYWWEHEVILKEDGSKSFRWFYFTVPSYICKSDSNQIIVFYTEGWVTMTFDMSGNNIDSIKEDYPERFWPGVPNYINNDYIIFGRISSVRLYER